MKTSSKGKVTRSASLSDKDKIFWEKHSESLLPPTIAPGKGVTRLPMANISYRVGATINVGNFESLRVDVEVSTPAFVSKVPQTLENVRKYVEAELASDVVHYRNVGRKDLSGGLE
jgi:hypothetical protein